MLFRAQKADRQFNAIPEDKTRTEGSNYQEADCNQMSRKELFSSGWTFPDGGRPLSFLGGGFLGRLKGVCGKQLWWLPPLGRGLNQIALLTPPGIQG